MSKENNVKNEIANFRDLGGYTGQDGLTVRKNLIYRSGNLDFSTKFLQNTLDPLGISIVFDLRSSDELEEKPYTLPDHIQYRHRPVLVSLEEELAELDLEFPGYKNLLSSADGQELSPEIFQFLAGFMERVYTDMGENPLVFGKIIKEMIENGGKAVLFHCSAGKDRTGILASMILLSLGVSIDDVKKDYLLSNECRREAIKQDLKEITAVISNPRIASILEGMLLVKEEYIDSTLAAVNSYPSFEDYAQEMLKLDAADLAALRTIYLE